MMRYLTLKEVLEIHRMALAQSGGAAGILNLGSLEAAVVQPYLAFAGEDLYRTVFEKASALAFSLIKSHPFLDGNKRTGHAAMETFLLLNGYELDADVDEQEHVIVQVAAGEMGRESFCDWVRAHLVRRSPS